jgi:hypothetical protein
MVTAPFVIRCKVEDPGENAYGIISLMAFEKLSVPTVVKDDEGADHESCRGESEQQSQPIGDVNAVNHQVPEHKIGDERIGHLPDATPQVRSGISGDNFAPAITIYIS